MTDIASKYQHRAAIAKALAHSTRLYIVDELSRGERCVCDLTKDIGADISTVSKHLALLRDAGIVRDDKRGREVYYSLACDCVLDFFHCIEAVIAERDNSAKDAKGKTACACCTR